MTYTEVAKIKAKGIQCKTDIGLYDASYYHNNFLKILSLYGSPQQVKAIFGILASGDSCQVIAEDKEVWIRRDHYKELRFRSMSLGYGKKHGLIWVGDINRSTIIWFSPEEKLKALHSAISKRRIPFDRAWTDSIEKILLEERYITKLQGWGGIGGYKCNWEDDAICNLIAEKIIKSSIQK